ncbi:Retrovirus-related Pol polyprotein [Thelohanellus kitauei]|uniref:Retrovirus-related Pol polyprotein n=1 Tax=Thelohanellus kitauei TaxID=669202 RepID=A0A0C2N4A2_THEKT|nr:Retrovirus-related Pol polyprotein [Thelohanellus kitauei]
MATRNPENLPTFSRTSDPSSWIFRFQLRAEFEGWSPEKQSSILPTFYDDDLLKEYQNSPMASLPASEKKLKQTMEWMGDISKRSDKLSSDYSKFENMSLAPGQDMFSFKTDLECALKAARPTFSKIDREFLVMQKILKELPHSVSIQLRAMEVSDPAKLCQAANILLTPDPQRQTSHIPKPFAICEIDHEDEGAKEVAAINSNSAGILEEIRDCLKSLTIGETKKNSKSLQTKPIQRTDRKGCFSCGSPGHLAKECKGLIICEGCGKQGHSIRICRNTKNYSRYQYSASSFLNTYVNPFTVPFEVSPRGGQGLALIDTGSCISLVKSNFIGKRTIYPVKINLRSVNGTNIGTLGSVSLQIKIAQSVLNHNFVVSNDIKFDMILGRDVIIDNVHLVLDCLKDNQGFVAGISQEIELSVNKDLPSAHFNEVKETLLRFQHCFSRDDMDIGYTSKRPHIIDTGNAHPISSRPYRIPIHLKHEIDNQIDKMVKYGIIRESSSPWCSPVLLVKKKDDTWRFCVDFRKINAITIKDHYSAPLIEEILDNTSGYEFYSRLDLQSGYWQCSMQEDSKNKTAFRPYSDRFFWPDMASSVKKYISECLHCNKNKSKNYSPKAELNPIRNKSRFEMWELDFTGPLPMTKRGNKYIMVCVDHYSKWIEAAAIPDISAETAARVLFTQVVSRFGVPKTILTDQGTAFESKLFTHLCQHLGIEKLRSTAYHPETNGLVERSNKSIKELLRIAVQKDPSDWDMNLDTCLFALRTACNASTGLPPSKIVFGSETQLPKNLSIQDTKMFSAESNHHVYVQKLERVMKSTFQLVDQNLVKSANKQKKSFDNKIYETKYVKGDYVLVKYQQGNKLSQKFEGPFEITGVKHPKSIIQIGLNESTTITSIDVHIHQRILW